MRDLSETNHGILVNTNLKVVNVNSLLNPPDSLAPDGGHPRLCRETQPTTDVISYYVSTLYIVPGPTASSLPHERERAEHDTPR